MSLRLFFLLFVATMFKFCPDDGADEKPVNQKNIEIYSVKKTDQTIKNDITTQTNLLPIPSRPDTVCLLSKSHVYLSCIHYLQA